MLRGNSFTVLHLQFLKETAVHAKQQWNNVKGSSLRLWFNVDKKYGSICVAKCQMKTKILYRVYKTPKKLHT